MPSCATLVTAAILALVAPSPAEAQSRELKRLNAGDFRLYYTEHSPQSLHYRGAPIVDGIYFYTAVKTDAGKFIEGFNFRRDEDGLLEFGQQKTDGGYRLTWSNKRYIYENTTRRTDQVAGEATVTLTLTGEGATLRHQAKIEPNPGFGEIGFFLSEERLTGGREATYLGTLADGTTVEGTFPIPARDDQNIHHDLIRLTVGAVHETFDFGFSDIAFPGSHGLHFQDFRDNDTRPGRYRVVVNFDTAEGNEFDHTWRLKVERKQATARAEDGQLAAGSAEELAKTPELPAGTEAAPLGDATVVTPRVADSPPGELKAAISEEGQVTLVDGDQTVIERDYFGLFAPGQPTREESRDGGLRRISLHYDAPKGSLTKEVVVSADDAWVLWTVTAKEEVRGEVGFYCPPEAFTPPSITYRAINQAMVEQREEPELSSSYCIISGDQSDFREFQCGASRLPDWIFQDLRESQGAYRFVAVPRLSAGAEWRAVFRYVRNSPESYPSVSFEAAREERGILSTLLTDAMTDGFTIVPARSSRYTLTNRPLSVTLKYVGLDEADRAVDLDCRLTDMWGRLVAERSYQLRNGGERFAAIQFLVSLSLNGAYRLALECRSGNVSRTRELVFTVLPEVADTGYRPDSVFGAAIGHGDYLGTLAQRIGLKWNRCHCAIGDTQAGIVQPERGQYTWEPTEEAVAFHERYGLFACHSISEGWKAQWLSNLWKEAPFEEYLRVYIDEYVRPLATRFKGRIRCWEVTNEPYYQFKDCPDKWVALMKATYETLKEIDPECTVVGTCGPPGSMGYSWYRRTFELGALDHQDAVSSHLYHFGPWVGSGVALTVRKWMQGIRAIMEENGKVLPLWNSETTVTPPASMYTHPSHTRYVRYHPGESPTDPVEQTQAYFKVLVIHAAEDVKYSFHIFHGGVEYTSHTGEYDETPLAFLATQAALAKHLEQARYVGDIDLHPEIQMCLFRNGERLIAIPWGPMFLKRDRATVRLPLAVDRFTARDVLDNPLPVEGDENETVLPITWEGFYLLADGMPDDEFRNACEEASVAMQFVEEEATDMRGTFFGEDAGPAARGDWLGFHAVDLSSVGNRGFRDETPEDGEGGWTDEGENDLRWMPTGDWLINDVPFRIIDPEQNAGTSCVVLKGGMNPNASFPESVTIPIGQRLSKLHFLHTVTWGLSSGPAFRYVLHYADGVSEEVPVVQRENVADWWWLGDLPEAKLAWEGPNPVRERVRIYHAEHEATHPKGAQAVLDRIEIVSEGSRAIPVILAITGAYSN